LHNKLGLEAVEALREAQGHRVWRSRHRNSEHLKLPFLGFDVDKKMAVIIESLWVLGMPTHSSCEGFPELCHRYLPSNDTYYARTLFARVADAARFLVLISEVAGVGETYTDEPFELKPVLPSYLEEGEDEELYEFIERSNAASRGEVRFHPEYLEEIEELLSRLVEKPPYAEKLKALRTVTTADEAYEVLDISAEVRREAEHSQNFIIDDPTRDPDELRYSRSERTMGW